MGTLTCARMTPAEFAAKWRGVDDHRAGRRPGALHRPVPDARRADAQRGRPDRRRGTPSRRAPRRSAAATASPTSGSADFFAWEYKGKGKDLKAAYLQLLDYREDLEQPAAPRRLRPRPDRDPHELHRPRARSSTPSPSTTSPPTTRPSRCAILRAVFTAPEELRPRIEPAQITEKAARHFAELAQSLRARGHDPQARRPLPRPAPVLPVRRGRRPPAEGHLRAPVRGVPRPSPTSSRARSASCSRR